MRAILSPRFLLAFLVASVAFYAVYVSLSWPLRAGLFPRVIGIPLFILAVVEMLWTAFKPEGEKEGHAVDFEFASNVEPAVARKRTVAMFLWVLGLLALILLFGFSIGVPLFVFFYLKTTGGEKWPLKLALTLI
jgi:hypothetical protein